MGVEREGGGSAGGAGLGNGSANIDITSTSTTGQSINRDATQGEIVSQGHVRHPTAAVARIGSRDGVVGRVNQPGTVFAAGR